jgi:predicted acetyltransferase
MASTVRAPRDEDERVRFERILQESFGNEELPWSLWMERIGHANLRVLLEDGAMRGGLGFYRFAQHWGGRAVPMIGLAGVGVAPQARGRGVAKQFLLHTVREAKEEGIPLAALYASSLSVYRSIGFEPAGNALKMKAPIASLPRGDASTECEPFSADLLTSEDGATLRSLYAVRARAWNGHLDRSDAIWSRIVKPYKGVARAYRFGPSNAPEGYVVYMHAPEEATLHFGVTIRDLVLTTPAAAQRCMALLHGTRSLGDTVRWLGCASDPLLALLPEETTTITDHTRWLLRILDPVRALTQRGYACDGEAAIDVRDRDLGDVGLVIRVRAGTAEVERRSFGRAEATLDVRGLAALYSGFAHPSALVAAGLASGDTTALSAIARLFQAHEPWLCDWF